MEVKCAFRTTTAGNLRGDGLSSGFHGYEPPSFSSTLLDSIYRSIDESSHDLRPSSRSRSQSRLRGAEEEILFEELLLKKQNSSKIGRNSSRVGGAEEKKSRDRIFGGWMENENLVIRRRSLPPEMTTEFAGLRSDRRRSLGSMKVNSSPGSSSESNSVCRFSSYADSDFLYSAKKKKSNSLNPIRTSISDPRPPKSDSAGKSAKSRAMKLYGDLKRMKQPISPGGKLANFLNSLFSASGSSKKQRIQDDCVKRSCLSKRPSSSRRYDDCVKRSVRFCPVSEDPGSVEEDLKLRVKEKNRRVQEMARDLLRKYQQRNGGGEEMAVDDDGESCCSSDLFELEIGVDRYCEELPVYETTRVDTNRAIASRRMA